MAVLTNAFLFLCTRLPDFCVFQNRCQGRHCLGFAGVGSREKAWKKGKPEHTPMQYEMKDEDPRAL